MSKYPKQALFLVSINQSVVYYFSEIVYRNGTEGKRKEINGLAECVVRL